MYDLDEMDKFLETLNLPRRKKMSRHSKESESVIKNFPTQKKPRTFTSEFYQLFKDDLTPTFLKLFQNLEEEEMFPNLFCVAKDATIKL